MSGEEGLPEDRKLSAVKSWFTRSVSFGGVHGSSTALAAAAASKGLSEGNGHNGEDQEAWGGFSLNLKQLSMRRSKAGSEHYERETALGSPSMTPRNVTPLVPLTPLRWKSSPLDPEEPSENAGLGERSRLGLRVTNSGDALHSQGHSEERMEDDDEPAENTEQKQERKDRAHSMPFDGFCSKPQSTAAPHDEENDRETDQGDESPATESPSCQDMKSFSGEDVMTMTIDFLRARLLAERSASKFAKDRIHDLSRKVLELELNLEIVVEEKNKAEKSAEEALLKLLTGDYAQVADCTARAAQNRAFGSSEGLHFHVQTSAGSGSGGEDIKEELRRAESSVGGFSRTASISSVESKDSEGSRKSQLGRNETDAATGHGADLWVTPKNMFVSGGAESPREQERRAAIESRLRSMWSQISADVSALAGDGSQESLVQEQLMSWMEQVPAVLQNRIPPTSAQDIASQDSQFILSPPEGIQDKVHVRARSDAEILLEEYEAHKRVQREWERNYHESKQGVAQSKGTRTQPDYPGMDDDPGGPNCKESDSFGTIPRGKKSSLDFTHHPRHLLYDEARKPGFHSDFEGSWGAGQPRRNTAMDDRRGDGYGHPDQRQRLAHPALDHPQWQAERPAPPPREAHEPESREWQQGYGDHYFHHTDSPDIGRRVGYARTPLERDAEGRPHITRSAEDPLRNPHYARGDLGPTHTDTSHRPREHDLDSYRNYQHSERPYRHGRRRSRSANSSNWPTERDTRGTDRAPQQTVGEMQHPSRPVYPRKAAHNSFGNHGRRGAYEEEDLQFRRATRHPQDTYLGAKSDGPPQPNRNGDPANAGEPKLYLGYGPAYDAPRDQAPKPPFQQDRVSNKSITDVLLALQKAKANIQKSGAERASFPGITIQPSGGPEPPTQYGRTKDSDARIRLSNSSPSLNSNPTAMGLRPAANGHLSYIDQLTAGRGSHFFSQPSERVSE